MASVIFIDTSVLTNLLNVPGRNRERDVVNSQLRDRVAQGQLILPVTTVVETGNHIGHIGEGSARRGCAQRFAEVLRKVVDHEAPFVMHEMGWNGSFLASLIGGGSTETSLVEHLARQLIGCGDLTILIERDRYLERVAKGTTADIWTLDDGLRAYA